MKLVVCPCAGVLLGNVRTELHMLTDCLAERLVVGHARLIERLQIRRDEPLTLLVGDLDPPRTANRAGEPAPDKESRLRGSCPPPRWTTPPETPAALLARAAQARERKSPDERRGFRSGPWRNRTSNLGIKSPLLCQLS
jgi:hypothetical protein